MGGGVIIGVIWGVLVSGVVLAAVSLSTPLPPRPDAIPVAMEQGAGDLTAPEALDEDTTAMSGGNADDAGPDRDMPDPLLGQDSTEDAAVDPVRDSAPPPETDIAMPPVAPTAPAGEADAAPGMASVPDDPTSAETPVRPDAPEAEAEADAATAPVAQTDPAPTPPATATPPVAAQDGADLPTVPDPITPGEETAEAGLVLPQSSDAPRLPQGVVPAPDLAAAPTPAPEAEEAPMDTPIVRMPQIASDADTSDPMADTGSSEASGPAPAAPRLPQIAGATSDAPDETAVTPAETAAEATPEPDDLPPNALRDNAVAFEAAPDAPLLAIVLIDDPDTRLTLETLTSFTFPVTFAIDPTRPDAAARAEAFRAAGFEVVILADILPDAATPADFEVAFESAQATLPHAVAVMDTPESRIQADRPILDAAVAALQETGHGLIAFPRGLNAAEQSARRADVASGTLFRMLDDEDQRATVITRFLTRAGFAAGTDGAVIVAGRTRPDTVTALFSWAVGSRSEAVTLAPLSAVLQRSAAE